MESKRLHQCAMVNGDMKSLTREQLKAEFSKFGKVTKVFIHPEDGFAKVYLDTIQGITKACRDLNKVNNWKVSLFTDEYPKKRKENSHFQNNDLNTATQDVCSNFPSTDQESSYVDVHGRDIEVIQDDDEKLYISLDDLKSAGFYVFPKPDFESSDLPKEFKLEQFRQFLLNQGKNYILSFKLNFSEKEILDVFEKVEKTLLNPTIPTIGTNRQVHCEPSGNFSITTRNDILTNSGNYERSIDRGSRRVPDNVRSSTSHFRKEARGNQQNRGYRENRNERNYANTNTDRTHGQDRRPRRYQDRSYDNQTTSNDVDEEKWDDNDKAEPNTESKSSLAPKVEAHMSDIVNKVHTTSESSSKVIQVQNDDEIKDLPPVEQVPQPEKVSDQEKPEKTAQGLNTTQSTPPASQTDDAAVTKNEEHVLVKYGDLECVKLPLGINDYVCYSCTGETVYLVPMTDEIVVQLAELETIQPEDSEPYPVDLMEMCLAKFNDSWYRGLVTDVKNDDIREVLFLDYGNTEDISVEKIRRFPEKLKVIPILAASTRFVGIPDKQNVYDRIKELMPDESLANINVLKANPDTLEYAIEVPSVYEQLRKDGLIN